MSLELKNVEKKVGAETHIYSTNLRFEKNTINVLLGSTLSGKTTLMQIMVGLDKPTSGEIWFNEKNVTGVAVQKRNASMVYQQFINYSNFTVFENIASPLKILGVKEDEIKFQIETSTASSSKDPEDTVYPETDDLDYPDLEFGLDKPKSNMISLDQLSVEEDSDLPLSLEREPEPIREDLAKEIESELSPDDFWAADEEEEGETTPTIELSQDLDDDLDDSRESFVVGVGDPSAPVEPIKPSQKPNIQIETSQTSFNEDEIVEKIKASLAPMLEDIVRKYMDEKIEKVAWEIIPDVAENLIRKEIKELSQASRNS